VFGREVPVEEVIITVVLEIAAEKKKEILSLLVVRATVPQDAAQGYLLYCMYCN
jgi:hypothetical protein